MLLPIAPDYVDINNDGGVSIFDFSTFAANFSQRLYFPDPRRPLPMDRTSASTKRTGSRNVSLDDETAICVEECLSQLSWRWDSWDCR